MIFDKLCKVAERRMPDIASIVDKSKLFWFPGKPHEFLPKEVNDQDMEFLSEQFMLPFPNVSIEDMGGLVILIDRDKNARGVNNERYYIDVTRFKTDNAAYDDFDRDRDKLYKESIKGTSVEHKDPMVITFGAIEQVQFVAKDKFFAVGRIERLTTVLLKAKDDDIIFSDYLSHQLKELPKQLVEDHLKAALKNAMCAIQEVLYANTPNKFILEETPNKRRQQIRGRIARSRDRPMYTLVSPQKIRERMKLPDNHNGEKQTRLFLGRRAHPRTYHDQRYINMQGKTVMIPAIWPGESIKVVGNKRYKIMLDL